MSYYALFTSNDEVTYSYYRNIEYFFFWMLSHYNTVRNPKVLFLFEVPYLLWFVALRIEEYPRSCGKVELAINSIRFESMFPIVFIILKRISLFHSSIHQFSITVIRNKYILYNFDPILFIHVTILQLRTSSWRLLYLIYWICSILFHFRSL